jgi:hypothetical protein
MVVRFLNPFCILIALVFSKPALALFQQTAADLAVLEDTLKFKFGDESEARRELLPILLATPRHLWKESRDDFAASVIATFGRVFTEAGTIINCPDCDTWRLNVRDNQQIMINNGELSLSELGALKQTPAYANAKTIAFVRETASGVEFKIIALNDGKLVHQSLSDSTKDLNTVKPYLNYAAERERRLRGESLSYVFVNFGVYPNGLFQLEFIEQWGSRNQHLSGIGISLLNPVFALGGVYHYLMPGRPRLNFSGAIYYPLANAIASAVTDDSDLSDALVLQASVQYMFSNSYAAFAAIGTEGGLSIGLTMFNPLFLPILL